MNKNEEEQFSDLKFFFDYGSHFFSNKQNLILKPNHETPSNKRDFMANADAIVYDGKNPFLYVQNASVSHDQFYRASLSSMDKNKWKAERVVVAGYHENVSTILKGLCKNINELISKKSKYINWPKKKNGNPILFITSYTNFTFKSQDAGLQLQKLVCACISKNMLDSKYKKIIIAFRNQKENNMTSIPYQELVLFNGKMNGPNQPFVLVYMPYLFRGYTTYPTDQEFEWVASKLSYNNYFIKTKF